MSSRSIALAALALLTTAAYAQTEQPDNYKWLEDVHGKRAMDWVEAHNAASAKILHGDPRFAALEAEALKVAESPDRLPDPQLHGGLVYNAWQDASHVRGILRRTTLSDYNTAQPHWKTTLDYDALGKKDHKSWVDAGLVWFDPSDRLCLVGLSDGGEDARVYREFDLTTGQFVKNGFAIPRAKSEPAWLDKNHLLLTSEWGPGTLTESGYPYIAKIWTRGTPLSAAKEVYRGTRKEVGVSPLVLRDGQGHQLNLIQNHHTFFGSYYFVWERGKTTKLGLPIKSDVDGLLNNRLIVSLQEDWKPEGSIKTYPQGSVLAIGIADISKDPLRLKPAVVFEPSTKEFAQDVQVTKSKLILTTLDNVQGRAYLCGVDLHGTWSRRKLALGDNLAVDIESVDQSGDKFFLGTAGFITPQSIYLADAASGSFKLSKSRKPQFDASDLTVEQLRATSKDGTKVPYFVVHKRDLKDDGSNPTILEAYGGFQVSQTPYYSAMKGKLWLERGGVYVLANIRGGGEFGPAWHDAGLKTHRQRIYDDFAAVGQDLVARKITSPRRLGIEGGSNGGLLMGVEFTQHPEMWNAVSIEVPLLDMLGFEHLAAGASWVGEYGSVSVPEERQFLASISPYNQLRKDVNYPEPLIFTTTKDDRVGPVHARKFAARLEEFGKPFFYDEITEGGHAAGADLKQTATTEATIFIYFIRKLMD
jgi:prolyl oligopeptidase